MSLMVHLAAPQLSPPVVSVGLAVAASACFTASYVGSLYLSPAGRLHGALDRDGTPLDRDHPTVIRARIKTASAATATTLVAAGSLVYLRAIPHHGWLLDTLNVARLLGIPLPVPSVLTSGVLPIAPSLGAYLATVGVHVAAPVLLTSLLYLGPLTTLALDAELPGQANLSWSSDVVDKLTSPAGVRNFAVGPLTEELVFRASILVPLFLAGVSRRMLVFATPAFFGIAHVHHAYNVFVARGRTRRAAIQAALTATAQFVYTTAFGWFANTLFLSSGAVIAPTAAHVVCNLLGLPNPAADSKRHPKNSALIWISHAAGVALFARFLGPLTSPTLFGGSLYWS